MNISKVKLRDAILRLVVEQDSAGLDQPDIEDSMSRSFLEISPEDVDSALQWLKAKGIGRRYWNLGWPHVTDPSDCRGGRPC